MKKLKLVDLIVSMIVLYFAAIPLHEYAHLIALVALGGKGYIYFTHCIIQTFPQSFVFSALVFFAGGLGVAGLYLLWRLTEEDPEDKAILVSISLLQIVYGVAEGLRFVFNNRNIAEIGSILGHLAMVGYLLYSMWKVRVI